MKGRTYILYLDPSQEQKPKDTSRYMRPNDEIRFGKHKGKTLKEVLKSDPAYIKWAIDNGVIKIYG